MGCYMYSSTSEHDWEKFLEKYVKIDNLEDEKVFLNAVLTYSERQEIQKRVRIFEELFKNQLTQKDIAEKLNVSIANVTRGVNVIRSLDYDLKGIFDKLRKSDDELHGYGTGMGEDGWTELIDKYDSPRELEDAKWWSLAIFTHAERDEMAKRVRIFEELYAGKLPQHEIASKLKVSHANVTRGVNTIRSIQPHYDLKAILDKINK